MVRRDDERVQQRLPQCDAPPGDPHLLQSRLVGLRVAIGGVCDDLSLQQTIENIRRRPRTNVRGRHFISRLLISRPPTPAPQARVLRDDALHKGTADFRHFFGRFPLLRAQPGDEYVIHAAGQEKQPIGNLRRFLLLQMRKRRTVEAFEDEIALPRVDDRFEGGGIAVGIIEQRQPEAIPIAVAAVFVADGIDAAG